MSAPIASLLFLAMELVSILTLMAVSRFDGWM
jgi:hypothetical protein